MLNTALFDLLQSTPADSHDNQVGITGVLMNELAQPNVPQCLQVREGGREGEEMGGREGGKERRREEEETGRERGQEGSRR